MRKRNLYIFYFLMSLCFVFSTARAQQVFKTTTPSVIGYLEYLPQDYNSNSNKYPIVIFLHGTGERGNNSTDPAIINQTIQNVAKLGPPMYVKNGAQFPFILISPQLKNNYGDWPTDYVLEVINHVKTYLRIDERRIYLTGLSLGGGGTWWTAQDHPELFAAIAPVCGSRNNTALAKGMASENLPVWAFHGDADTTVPMSRSVNMVNAINSSTPTPNPLAKITIYPGVTHSAWTNAYKNDNTIHNPNIYQWLVSFTNTINKGNKIPIANAGADKNVIIPAASTVISGSATDADGTISSYSWTQINGPSTATLVNNLTNAPTISALVSGTYTFRLTVTDNSGNKDSDYIKITAFTDALPTANAGPDKSITLPVNSISVTGSGTDTDGTIKSYGWTKVSGGTATLSGAATAVLSVSNLLPGSYAFRLTVTDDKGGSKYDDMIVTVNQAVNIPPIANAGPDKSITLPTSSFTITGSGTDSDGTIASYAWTKVSGGIATLGGITTTNLAVSNLVQGTYVFRLTVTDNKGAIKSDDTNVIVNPAPANIAPLANAGADQTITLPNKTVVLYGSGTDSDGSVASYSWEKVSGRTCSITILNQPSLKVYGLNSGTYDFKLTVTDNTGATGYDHVIVVVKDVLGAAASVDVQPVLIQDPGNEPILGKITGAELSDATVVIYNDSGERLYSGNWDHTKQHEVMSKNGLYIYNVIKEGKRTDAGRIFIRN